MSDDHYSRVWASVWAEPWDNDMKLLAIYLLTGPKRRTEGLYRLPLEYAMGDLKWPLKKVRDVLSKLEVVDFVDYDKETQLVLVLKALKRHGLNDNQIKGVVKAFTQLPDSPLRKRFESLSQEFNEKLAKALAEACPRNGATLAK